MIGVISNPTKTITVNFPIDEVRKAVKNMRYVHTRYVVQNENDILNMYSYGALEFLSAGVYVEFTLTEVSANKTQIFIEVKRKIGAFDEWVEVQKAGEHIVRTLEAISKLLAQPEVGDRLIAEKAKVIEEAKSSTPVGHFIFLGVCIAFLIIVIAIVS